jgi:hypothetical protein
VAAASSCLHARRRRLLASDKERRCHRKQITCPSVSAGVSGTRAALVKSAPIESLLDASSQLSYDTGGEPRLVVVCRRINLAGGGNDDDDGDEPGGTQQTDQPMTGALAGADGCRWRRRRRSFVAVPSLLSPAPLLLL